MHEITVATSGMSRWRKANCDRWFAMLCQIRKFPEKTEFGDVWALGATIHLFAHGRVPVDNMPHAYHGSPSEWCKEAIARKPQPLPRECSSQLNQDMVSCLELEMRDRVSGLALTRDLFQKNTQVGSTRSWKISYRKALYFSFGLYKYTAKYTHTHIL